MSRYKDISDKRFGRLIAIKVIGREEVSRCVLWECECDCGKKTIVRSSSLLSGSTKSCGCLQKDRAAEYNKNNAIHGKCETKLYKSWAHMKERCLNPNCKSYKNYGARGITICEDWLEFENFNQWAINNGYKKGLTIDRIDNNGDYKPSNCRWVNRKKQNNNRRDNVILEFNGKKKTLAQWAEELNINYSTLHSRIYTGWSVEKALTQPVKRKS